MENILTNFDLTTNESKILLEYYNNPLSNPARISKKLKMDKSSTYRAVESLIEKKLLRYAGWKNGSLFSPTDPANLKQLVLSKEEELENNKKALESLITTLQNSESRERLTSIEIEEGIDSLKKRMSESLQSRELIIREIFRHHEFFNDKEYVTFVRNYVRERKKLGIKLKEINLEDPSKTIETFPELFKSQKKYNKEIRFIADDFKDSNSIRIWDDTINIISYGYNNKFIVVTIKDRFVAEFMKNMFEFIWNRSEPLPPIKLSHIKMKKILNNY